MRRGLAVLACLGLIAGASRFRAPPRPAKIPNPPSGFSSLIDLIDNQGHSESNASGQPGGRAEFKVSGTADAETPNWSWIVEGTIRDNQGRPLSGVEVSANGGVATLVPVGVTRSNADGRYQLRIRWGGMGVSSGTLEPLVHQSVVLRAHIPRHAEINLGRQGRLIAVNREPKSDEERWIPRDQVIISGQARTIDFVMVPAASLAVELVDSDATPVPGHFVSLAGRTLPPGSSILAQQTTDVSGRCAIVDVPVDYTWYFSDRADARDDGALSGSFRLKEPGEYRAQLRRVRPVGDTADRLELISFRTADERDILLDVFINDPERRPPLLESDQRRARDLLLRVRDANRPWLVGPAPDVRRIQYRETRGNGTAISHDFDPAHAKRWERQGVVWQSALHFLVETPNSFGFRAIDEADGRIVVAYFRKATDNDGEPPHNSFGGSPTEGLVRDGPVSDGIVILDKATLAVREHTWIFRRRDRTTETFSDYETLPGGAFAPRRIEIREDDARQSTYTYGVISGVWLARSGTSRWREKEFQISNVRVVLR